MNYQKIPRFACIFNNKTLFINYFKGYGPYADLKQACMSTDNATEEQDYNGLSDLELKEEFEYIMTSPRSHTAGIQQTTTKTNRPRSEESTAEHTIQLLTE